MRIFLAGLSLFCAHLLLSGDAKAHAPARCQLQQLVPGSMEPVDGWPVCVGAVSALVPAVLRVELPRERFVAPITAPVPSYAKGFFIRTGLSPPVYS